MVKKTKKIGNLSKKKFKGQNWKVFKKLNIYLVTKLVAHVDFFFSVCLGLYVLMYIPTYVVANYVIFTNLFDHLHTEGIFETA